MALPSPPSGIRPLVAIPARMAATRLPGKPLLDIAGKPMIVRVWEIAAAWAQKMPGAEVVVAAGDPEIVDVVTNAGGKAVLTDPDLPSGTDRCYAAAQVLDPDGAFDVVVNLQGDQPVFDADSLSAVLTPLTDARVDIATLASVIRDSNERTNPNVVKLVPSFPNPDVPLARALYFTRAVAPTGDGPLYHHVGIYAFRRAALERFVRLAPSPLEIREKLEQLRALEHDMRIDAAIIPTGTRIGVDGPDDLARARAYFDHDKAGSEAGA
ncbi:3-deoxy-manno-octulosonate cytidylyltransferase [Pyruvatibacter sp.]|uniref:3-deoxy-manno-octulosonate cytidylyltransferase n=1 Tax=Pyruvatibacter sp. TaxID=1981328 RepID=UPI0032EE63AE